MLNTHTRTHAVARANISLSACAAGTVQSQYCAAGTDSHSTVPLVQHRQSQYCAAGTVQTVTELCRWYSTDSHSTVPLVQYRQSQYCAAGTVQTVTELCRWYSTVTILCRWYSHSTVPLVQYRQSQYCAAGTVQTVTVLCRWYRQSQYCASQCTALACPTAAVCTGAVHAYWLIRFSRTLVKHLGATRVAFVQTVRSWCTSFCSPQLNY
jgi:hypothetical protein